MTVTIEKQGRRYYIAGNTYPIKDQLRAAGCKWDPDRKQWWTGKKDVAERLASKEIKPAAQSPDEVYVIGKASYKGRSYYVQWAGVTKKGNYAFHLVTLDAKIDFWADGSPMNGTSPAEHEKQARWEKTYQDKRSLAGIRQFIEDNKKAKEEGFDSARQRRAVHSGTCMASGCGAAAGPSGYCRQCEFDEYDM